MIVLDASCVVELLLRSAGAEKVEARLFRPRETWHAPHLLDVEVAQVLRRYAASGDFSDARGSEALALLSRFPLARYAHEPLLPRVWQLRGSLTAYDATYVALAEALAAPLVTRDARLARAGGHRARIELA